MGPGHLWFIKAPQEMLLFHLGQIHLARGVLASLLPPNPLSDPCGAISNTPANICLFVGQVCNALFLPRDNPKELLCAIGCVCVQRRPSETFPFSLRVSQAA